MGLIRLLLALCVVAGHTAGWYDMPLLDGAFAVQLFYVISGYYIADILCGKYNIAGGIGVFYSNRLLRLLPTYWIILLLTLLCMPLVGRATHLSLAEWRQALSQADIFSIAAIVFANIAILFQDMALFSYFSPSDGGIHGTLNFRDHTLPMYRFLLVPQAWSIGLELAFYALAPWLVTRSLKLLIGVILLSLLARSASYAAGFFYDPFSYRFFPFELATFCLGALMARSGHCLTLPAAWRPGLLLLCVVTILCFRLIPPIGNLGLPVVLDVAWRQIVLIGGLALALPSLAALDLAPKWDRYLGSLSYPLYINHHFVLLLVMGFTGSDGIGGWKSLLVTALALALAALLVRYVEQPVDRWRQGRIAALRG